MNWFLRLARLSLALLWLTTAGLAAAQTAGAGPVYIVQAGDTLFGIARQFGVTVEAVQAANPTVNAAALQVGQGLIIPGFAGTGGTLGLHPLEPGETLDSLALRLGLSTAALVRLNRIVNPSQLYINQPVVVTDELDAGPALPAGETVTLGAGEGLLALAAERGLNPWALTAANRRSAPGQFWPAAGVVLPGGERPLKALPAPLTDIQVRPLPPEQGRTFEVRVVTGQAGQVTGSFGPWPLTFEPAPDDPQAQVALLGIYRLADPNLYPLALTFEGAAGRVAFSQAVPVRPSEFGSDPSLSVDPVTLDPAVVQPEFEKIKAIVSQVTPARLWDGLFALPSVGVIRSRFGVLRSYNGGPYDSFHGGVDFSGGDDRPITAPAPGVVVLAEALTVRGNATILDHGWGVYTGYWHQSSILVQVGQRVAAGEIIGYQGSTGRVTGPHLHWEVFVGGNQVEPLEWTETAFP